MHNLTQQKLSIVQNQHTVLVLAQDGRELLSALESAKGTAAVASPLNAKDAWLRSSVTAFPRRLGLWLSWWPPRQGMQGTGLNP